MNCLALAAVLLLAQGGIEALETPRPAAPPRVESDDVLGDDLERLRAKREHHEAEEAPKPLTASEKRDRALTKETYKKRPRRFLGEVSLLVGSAATSGDKSGYALDPTSHFNAFVRQDESARLWYGLRIAPFAGSGYYKGKPGLYGLTFFGPMIAVGKIDPPPAGRGDGEEPAVSGWLVSGGIAALAKSGRTETAENSDRGSDFTPHRGAMIDGTGVWIEARYLRVVFGALGLDAVFGYQSGRQRQIVYAGLGAGAYY